MKYRISRRTRLCDSSGMRYVRSLHREEAMRLVGEGVIAVDEMRGAVVVSFRLTDVPLPVVIHAGSFGIHRQHVATGQNYGLSGGVVFSHKRTYGEFAQ